MAPCAQEWKSGVLFTTYNFLKSKSQRKPKAGAQAAHANRLDQLVEW